LRKRPRGLGFTRRYAISPFEGRCCGGGEGGCDGAERPRREARRGGDRRGGAWRATATPSSSTTGREAGSFWHASAVATSSSSPCRALPGGLDSAAKILSSGAAVFTSGLAVRHFAEVGGPQAVKELAKKEKEYVPSPKRFLFPPLLQRIYCRQVFTVDDLSSVLHEVLKQVATRSWRGPRWGRS